MSEAPKGKKGGTNWLLIGAIVALVGGAVGYLVYTKYFAKAQGVTNNQQGGGSNSSGSGNQSNSGGSSTSSISIYGDDVYDSAPRDWQIFTENPTNKCVGSSGQYGVYSGLTAVQKTVKQSGSTWTLSLSKGTYYLIIGQSGGDGLGTYSGTITVNGTSVPFSNVDNQHAAQFTVY